MGLSNEIYKKFEELVAVDATSFSERKMADKLKAELKSLGFEVSEDEAGKRYGGNAGNVYGFLKGEISGPPILFSAHMDTVEPGNGKKAIIDENGRITSAGDTVLGGDDVCGIVEILFGIKRVLERGEPHRDIEVLFPIAEELYTKGSSVFDYSKIKARNAYVLDMSGRVGTAAIAAPSIISFHVTVHGRASHAGFAPENGINAISTAAAAIAEIKQGHVNAETTLNIGQISGGTATNIVPDLCVCHGEIRSSDHERALKALEYVRGIFEVKAGNAGAEVTVDADIHMKAYKVSPDDPTVKNFERACEKLGISSRLVETFGGSDNNQFVKNGIHGIVLSCGMQEVHSVREYAYLQDIEMGVRLVEELICQHD